ncbi:uncharacterized protein PV09_05017 [Verruconis gallopava]|uniref:Uncharacterized protein n=1 Tax=Verruconis gallopava TaxID=253628 RepID=A0A0D2AX00_9PEZI|nr:uncharacterized protein PV09_05017 [Verruconis gallopava]KIW03704.1 hypothetical protein PV09_05017 [Verruconis gallopava]
MQSPSEPISEPSTTRSEVVCLIASKTDDRQEQRETQEDQSKETFSYRPPGYPDFGNMWTSPPQPLPGPDDHPFFKWIAEGAKLDPAVLATHRPPSESQQTTLPLRTVPSQLAAIQPPTVYPFIPSPTVAMEPYTPNEAERKSFPQLPSSSSTTPDLSSSPTEPSPASAQTTPVRAAKSIHSIPDKKTDDFNVSTAHSSAEEIDVPTHEVSKCTSTYMRLVLDADSQTPRAVANGQIWRSGSKRNGWRRHQWSLDVPQ